MARSVSREIEVAAPAGTVFDVLADPGNHPRIDGSGSVRETLNGPDRLYLDARFGMRMRIGLPYVISNLVVEFEEGRRIAWRHFGRHVWRYVLTPAGDGTRVVHTFDWGPSLAPRLLEVLRVPERNATAIEGTLARLKALVERVPPAPAGGANHGAGVPA